MNEVRICSVCLTDYTDHPAISRMDNITEICPQCGQLEAMRIWTQYIYKINKEQKNKCKHKKKNL